MIFKNILGILLYIACTEMVLKYQDGSLRYIKYISDFIIHLRIYVVSEYLYISVAVIFTDGGAMTT
jgi:hypothetical protein